MHPKHDEDFYGWAMANASLLKKGKYKEADMDKIIEEMETLGRSNKRELVSRSGVLIAHLLKWQYQPDMKEINWKSWKGTIVRQRIEIDDLLGENPSLKSHIQEAMSKAYKYAFAILEEETPIDLNLLPSQCPYTFEQIMNDTFYPE
jgi:hypothetical protein